MIFAIKLSIFALVSLAMSVVLNKKAFLTDVGKKTVLFWACILPFTFILRHELITVIASFALIFFFKKGLSPAACIAFFIACLAAVPDWSRYVVSLPGINKLIILYYWKVAVIALLVPLFFAIKKAPLKVNAADLCIIFFVFYLSLMEFRTYGFTTVLRIFTDNTLLYLVPYFVISRFMITKEDFHYGALGFLLLAIILASIFFVSQLVKEDFYNEFDIYSGWFSRIQEFRGGFLRLAGPLNGVLVAYLMAAGMLSLLMLKDYFFSGRLMFLATVFSFILAIIFGGSRGGMVAVVFMLCVYCYFVVFKAGGRIATVALALLFVVLAQVFDVSSMLSYNDEYGTFDYRKELYIASFEFIASNPLFGSADYINSGYFDHLFTGLGIIDIVSVYLQVMLKYGFIGLFLFCFPFLYVIFSLTRQLMSAQRLDGAQKRYAAMFLGLLLGYLFVIATTSTVSLVDNFGVIVLAFGRSIMQRHWA